MIEAVLDPSRVVSASLKYAFGGFWSGDADRLELGFGARVGARFDAEVNWHHNDVRLTQGDFTTDLVITRLNFDFSANNADPGSGAVEILRLVDRVPHIKLALENIANIIKIIHIT